MILIVTFRFFKNTLMGLVCQSLERGHKYLLLTRELFNCSSAICNDK